MPAYNACPDSARGHAAPKVLKIVIAGGLGVGKTTLVGTVSDIKPLTTEESLTIAGRDTDDLTGIEAKTTTTVAMDFGKISLKGLNTEVFLFGTPGQERFWFTWDDLCHGAVGAVVLADTRRLTDSFAAIGYFEQRRTPFVVAINEFDGALRYSTDEVSDALQLPESVPVLICDARNRASALDVLIRLIKLRIKTRLSPTHATTPSLGAHV
ncbi:ATP/GTP-binding protein [Streptomyces sp. NPDC006510]|uniref:GTP-binding protein n=1 Tax=Streptomyces sp. NPDC006510 TaxID=3155600 RepID=UPI0033AFB022